MLLPVKVFINQSLNLKSMAPAYLWSFKLQQMLGGKKCYLFYIFYNIFFKISVTIVQIEVYLEPYQKLICSFEKIINN